MQTKINQGELGKVCADAISELISACAKHPDWPDELTDSMDLDYVRYVLGACRTFNDTPTGRSAQSIFDEEQFEFFEAVMLGDGEAARKELTQAIAMLLRMYCHIPEFVQKYRNALQAQADYARDRETQKTYEEVSHAMPF